jgi:hypothetical protein
MSKNPQINASNYILNIVELQNVITSVTGQSATDALASQVAKIQQMVNYDQKRINADTIASFGGSNSITVLNNLNLSNSGLYSNGVPVSGVSTTVTGGVAAPGKNVVCLDTAGTSAWGFISSMSTADSIRFNGTGGEIARFTNTGNLGIGTTTPSHAVDVVGEGYFTGNVTAANFLTLSDAQFKTNIRPIEGASAIISSLNGVRFQWKEGGGRDSGFIAQNVQEAFPDAVYGSNILHVSYHKIIPILVEAVKELQERVRVLESTSRL